MKRENNRIKDIVNKSIGATKTDPIIEIIKGMHCDPKRNKFYEADAVERTDICWGLIKDEACKNFGISPRNFQNIINRINKKNNSDDPICICGQPIRLDIEEERINHKKLKKQQRDRLRTQNMTDAEIEEEIIIDKRTHYCTPNSMHPIFLQLNVSQLACLMRALANFGMTDDSGMPQGLGAYIYSQLSEYGISRLEETYAKQDMALKDFLDEMASMPEEEISATFHSDEESYEMIDYRNRDTLNLCCKNGEKCDIELKINGVIKDYKNVYVDFAPEGYELRDDENHVIRFEINDVTNLKTAKT